MNWIVEPKTADVQPDDICYFHMCYSNSDDGGCVVNYCVTKSCIVQG